MTFQGVLATIDQIAYVVPDIDAAVARWVEQFGAGPFFTMPAAQFPGWTYLGKPQDFASDFAFGQLGGVMIEFIRPLSDAPSVYSHAITGKPELHHYAVLVDSLEDATTRLGNPPVVTSAHTGENTRFTYNDTRPTLGVMIEVIEKRADVCGIFQTIADAAKGWDGSNPLRTLG